MPDGGADPRERYRRALEAIRDLKNERPKDHEAVLLVVAEALGKEIQAFYRVEAAEAAIAGVRSHAAHAALDKVYATLKAPEGRIRALDAPPVSKKAPGDEEGKRRLYDKFVGKIRKTLGLERAAV